MAEKPPEEGYISVVDEEPEILELLKWDTPQIPKQPEQVPQEKAKSPEKRNSKHSEQRDPFELPEPTFIEHYRLSKDLARTLCEELKPVMPDSTKSAEVSTETKVLAAIAFYATGKPQKITSKADPNITQYFLSTVLVQVTQAMNHPTIVKKYIHFPHLREERDIIIAKFYMKYGIPNVLGCIDCTHVPISKPDMDQKSHFNKSYHAKKVQIICDSDLTILSVDPSPGSMSHDAILNRHAVKIDLESLNASHEPCWLIGGPHYSQKPYIMTPIPKITKKSPVSPEKHFNGLHNQTHTAVIDTIKHLKSRWKCLQATCYKQFDPTTVSMMIVACCILHNLCNRRGLPICPMTQAEERLEAMKQKVANGPISKKLNDDADGKQVRSELVQRLWNERQLLPESNGPKKRARKDRPVEPQVMPNHSQVQMMPNQSQMDEAHKRSRLIQMLPNQSQLDEASKRARLMNPPPTYAVLTPAWSHNFPPL